MTRPVRMHFGHLSERPQVTVSRKAEPLICGLSCVSREQERLFAAYVGCVNASELPCLVRWRQWRQPSAAKSRIALRTILAALLPGLR